ncbi:MAG: ABC transporter ATP-binding protein [Pseudanabaenaceae cyanobacterium bins.68]|nr:ABC transporter ATP-binding protein [Pseudanabaenaceae cyanobacterium bins.68]
MAVPPILSINQIYAGYVPGVDILQGMDLAIYPGELIVVIGANGAGKSTLAKTVFGLVPVRSGSIKFGDKEISDLAPEQMVKLGLGYVPQVANVFPALTVAENLEIGAYLSSGSCNQARQRIYAIFPILAERQRQKAGTLSGGERQMLAMGRALMVSPQLLILDEPTAALSPILVQDIFDLVQQINQTGTTILLVEQNARKALAIADRAYVMEGGKQRFSGKGDEILNHPKIAELYLGHST